MSWHTQHRLHHTDHKPHSTDPHWRNQLQPLCQNLDQCLYPFCSLSQEQPASAPLHRPSPLRILRSQLPLHQKKQKPQKQSWVLRASFGFCHHSCLQSWPRSWCSLWVHNSPKQEHQTSQEQGNLLPLLEVQLQKQWRKKMKNLCECSLVRKLSLRLLVLWGCN